MISRRTIEQILDKSIIEDVIGKFIDLRKDGSRYKCCCPVHSEKTPSFVVSPNRNMFKCFGCGIGGNVITFLMEVQHMTFPEAVKYLANEYHIAIDADDDSGNFDRESELKKEAMLIANRNAAEFFAKALEEDNTQARFARDYAYRRWGKRFVQQEGIGFAPGRGAFLNWAEKKGLAEDILIETGLLRKKEGKVFDGFYDRITIPIRDRYGNVIGFTARTLSDAQPKYINSPGSIIYNKSTSIFGIHNAIRQAAAEELFYLVEGAPDVMRLQSLDINNTIAPLGTAWTEQHFDILKRYSPRLCFIPDKDTVKAGQKYGAGIEAVMKNGAAAFEAGFNVSVKEIPDCEKKEKLDPDSYILSKKILEEIPEEDFVVWYAKKLLCGQKSTSEKTSVIKTVANLLASIDDRLKVKMYIAQLCKPFNVGASLWQNAVNEAVKSRVEEKQNTSKKVIDQELYQKYGFYERHNCYISLGKDGIEQEWSNFTMTPLFHIKHQLNPKRLYRITNVNGQEELIELKQEDLVSLQRFRLRTEGFGNYIWKAKEEQLTKLKGFLYEATETAVEITQLGWQKESFYAFGNGVFFNGSWIKVDDYGIVRLGDIGNYYLPAMSKIYRNDRTLFQFERRFIHTNTSNISFRQYTDQMIAVFGDNAKVGVCFLLASLFKDVVTAVTKNFPLLNLFGPKGSGKSELGHTLMSFFIINNEPPNISQTTEAALADSIAQCANALVHIDEYKNSIDLRYREILKALYDGVGRTRMNMDRDKKREMTAVDCGIILSGQDMPTIDISIFTRMLFCTFVKTEFSLEEKRNFDELKDMRKLGGSHLVLQLLQHRKKFESEFSANYKSALSDVVAAVEKEPVEDRILRNWVIPLAAFRTLSGVIDVSFDYREMLQICVKGILRQNDECKSSNEIASFWQVVDFLHQNGDIYIDADYRIKYEREFRGKGMKNKIIFPQAKPILYLCTKRVMMLYKKNGNIVGESTLPTESLRFYLENSKEFLGIKNAVRFKILANVVEAVQTVTTATGVKTLQRTSRTDWALCFDYEKLVSAYNINLELETVPEDDPDPTDIDESDETIPYER